MAGLCVTSGVPGGGLPARAWMWLQSERASSPEAGSKDEISREPSSVLGSPHSLCPVKAPPGLRPGLWARRGAKEAEREGQPLPSARGDTQLITGVGARAQGFISLFLRAGKALGTHRFSPSPPIAKGGGRLRTLADWKSPSVTRAGRERGHCPKFA